MTKFQKFNSKLFHNIGLFFDTNPVVKFIAEIFGSIIGAFVIVVLGQDLILLILTPFIKSEGHAIMLTWVVITTASLLFLKKRTL